MANIDHFISTYEALNKDNLNSITTIYHDDIHFIDPIHEMHGLAALQDYFATLYVSVISCQFDIQHHLSQGEQAYLSWQMQLRTKKLNGGDLITLPGATQLRFADDASDKVIYHRDYYDLGNMIYENVPLLGRLIRGIKRNLG